MTEGEPLSVGSVLGLLVQPLDERGEDSHLPVTSSGGDEDVSGVEVHGGDGALVLFDVLGDPPIVFFFVVADGDALGSRGDSELVLCLLRGRWGRGGVSNL